MVTRTSVATPQTERLILTWLVGDRDASAANAFIACLNRVQLTQGRPQGSPARSQPGIRPDGVDYGMLVKLYGNDPQPQKGCSPTKLIGIGKDLIPGSPDENVAHDAGIKTKNKSLPLELI